ncbi:response regulator transcription factor [Ralstonia sp.]|uniref:response regulator transcription factor n=1 Tax=Ralstonia sp. TaxID=54061 RepID=UPI0031CE447E
MKFAILTSNPASFAHVAACLSGQDVTCVRCEDASALLRARQTAFFDFLMIDAQLFSTAGRLVLSWCECNADMCWPTLVFGHFIERQEMRTIFDTGVDDMVVGDFAAEELRARVRRILRRIDRKAQAADSGVHIVVGPYRLYRLTRIAMLNDTPIRLTAREFATAWLLFSSLGALLSRQQIASAVWGTEASVAERSIEQHIYKLRKKLCLGEATGVDLKTVYSRGYQLTVQPVAEQSRRVGPELMLAA